MRGGSRGGGGVPGARAVTDQMVRYGLVSGIVTGVLLAASAWALGPLFTTDPVVRGLVVPGLLAAGVTQPVAGVVFVLDGVLIGAGDGRYLAWAGLAVLVVYAPAAFAAADGTGGPGGGRGGVR